MGTRLLATGPLLRKLRIPALRTAMAAETPCAARLQAHQTRVDSEVALAKPGIVQTRLGEEEALRYGPSSILVLIEGVGEPLRGRAEGGVDAKAGESEQNGQHGDGHGEGGGCGAGFHGLGGG